MLRKKTNTLGIIGIPLIGLNNKRNEIKWIDYEFIIDKKENKKKYIDERYPTISPIYYSDKQIQELIKKEKYKIGKELGGMSVEFSKNGKLARDKNTSFSIEPFGDSKNFLGKGYGRLLETAMLRQILVPKLQDSPAVKKFKVTASKYYTTHNLALAPRIKELNLAKYPKETRNFTTEEHIKNFEKYGKKSIKLEKHYQKIRELTIKGLKEKQEKTKIERKLTPKKVNQIRQRRIR